MCPFGLDLVQCVPTLFSQDTELPFLWMVVSGTDVPSMAQDLNQTGSSGVKKLKPTFPGTQE